MKNIANIRVPFIAATEGKAHIPAASVVTASVMVSGASANFGDLAHFAGGTMTGADVNLSGPAAPVLAGPGPSASTPSRPAPSPQGTGASSLKSWPDGSALARTLFAGPLLMALGAA